MFRIPVQKPGIEVLSEGISELMKNLQARRLKEQELAQEQEYRQQQLQLSQSNQALRNYFEQLRTKQGQDRLDISKKNQEIQQGYNQQRLNQAQQNYQLSQKREEREANAPKSPLGKAIADYDYYLKKYGKDDERTQKGKEYLDRIAEGTPGTELTVDPETGAVTFTQGSRGRTGTQTKVVNGQLVQVPSAPTSNLVQSQQLANASRVFAFLKTEHPYIGQGSNARIMDDYMALSTGKLTGDKKQKVENDLINAAVAYKMVPEIASLSLRSQGVRATVPAMHSQEKSIKLGWPLSLDWVVGNLPKNIQYRVNKRHSELLTKLKEYQEQFFAKGMPIDLNQKSETVTPQVQPSTPRRKYSDEQLNKWKQEALDKGVSLSKIDAKMAKLKQEMI